MQMNDVRLGGTDQSNNLQKGAEVALRRYAANQARHNAHRKTLRASLAGEKPFLANCQKTIAMTFEPDKQIAHMRLCAARFGTSDNAQKLQPASCHVFPYEAICRWCRKPYWSRSARA